nr:hypothetical protein [Methanosarcina horonobensis]
MEEALECATALANIEIDLAFASNLVRTQETLCIILSARKRQGFLSTKKQKMKRGRKGLNGILIPINSVKILFPFIQLLL